MFKRIALVGVLTLSMAACSGFQSKITSLDTQATTAKTQALDNLQAVIAGLLDKANGDLIQADAEAMAATPPDLDFHNCSVAAIKVATAVKAVATAGSNANKGVIAQAELLSLFAPDSEQYNWVKGQLVSGCSAKITKTMMRIQNASNVIAGLPKLLGLAAPMAAALPIPIVP